MDIQLFYGIRLDDGSNADEIDGELEEEGLDGVETASGEPLLHRFGGGNNDGGLFFGLPAKEVAEGYSVESMPLAEIAKAAAGFAGKEQADLAWGGADARGIRDVAGLDGAGALQWLIVSDSD